MLSAEEVLFFDTMLQTRDEKTPVQDLDAQVTEILGKTVESLLSCIKCSSHDIVYEHKQTRSMDEGMTTFFTCRTCQTKWKD